MKDRVSITMLEDGIADVRMIRTDKMNALDAAMWAALVEAIETLKATPGLRVVVLSGEGRAFCAGLDLSSLQAERDPGASSAGGTLADRTNGISNNAQYAAWGWRELPVPVIAAVHGVAFGAGSQIMAAADIRYVHPDTRIAIMEMKWGLVPDVAGMALWRTQVADDVLREMIYTNRQFNGHEAKAMGFATHVSDDPLTAALELARIIANKNPHAVRGAKRLCNMLADATDAEILQAESDEQVKVIRTPNQIEAVMSEMEKRKPVFAE
ncbi:MAG: crotonase/enoyl-CoA hydratase family protein [Sphingomonadales bacterium]|jgi:enoyl-CoA hydratase/carnithine racemase|nr:crotonase/enoyl-CoA hydratase family protein [Sphingomonadales bacterium]MBK6718824.1 crotonase/enoyl-CoA hydratase family protein [Sphingomonadales bacterium]MBK7283697.1 crotonase/enoyl-CoA hydratase family protein [Sphingomonadales bacterium]MBK8272000.1 crotonase/enoyl-CoA hydratase family protein [Sphingomonadales bacterium]MBK9587825.1 crotonase/enoyl-CoA hydratase family protein [Sphingomonadales bacterium]